MNLEEGKYPDIKRYVKDKYANKTVGNLFAWFNKVLHDKQPVFIQFAGMYNNAAFVNGLVDAVAEDHIVMYGDNDDVVIIPFHAMLLVRLYNEELDEAILGDMQREREEAAAAQAKAQAEFMEAQKKAAEESRKKYIMEGAMGANVPGTNDEPKIIT